MFKQGQRVFTFSYGWGYVIGVDKVTEQYPIKVHFDSEIIEYFTYNGKLLLDGKHRVLFFNEPTISDICDSPKELPRWEIDAPITVKISENSPWIKRHFATWDGTKCMVYPNGTSSWTNSINNKIVTCYDYKVNND